MNSIKKKSQIKDQIVQYETLEKYSENISEYLKSENLKMDLDITQKKLTHLEETIRPEIEKEQTNTKKFLNKRVRDFFYEKLINDIYSKIDPHPDFNSVEIKLNFDLEKPSLDIFVKGDENEKRIVPNLYFSSAQINILSLSIFLASALHSKEYDCIFIDDPVQSMDSINILSTIDLFRSLAINYDKQIILSTHDQNFHNLLKKKIPDSIFNSKFLELESFGKLKQDINNGNHNLEII